MISASFGEHSVAIGQAVAEAREAGIIRRIRERDHTLWKPDPGEIANRLGWLRAPTTMRKEAGRIARFVEETAAGRVLVLGMGGSSLAAAAFGEIFGGQGRGGLPLGVVDTTAPDAIREISGSAEPGDTLHIVATKSGSTVETLSAFRYFHARTLESAGGSGEEAAKLAGTRFVAITDPGSPLAESARARGFADVFLNPSDVGGRYGALTFFGLVPAALVGVDIDMLLVRAEEAIRASLSGDDDRALVLGTAMGVLSALGRDKLTVTTSPEIEPFADWLEQLVAESTGKEGKGVLPVVREPLGAPDAYGSDRVFVDLALPDDQERDLPLADLERAGHPVIRLGLRDKYDLGGQIVLWELATAVTGALLGINPFDQPNVESAKARARDLVEAYRRTGTAPGTPVAPLEALALAELLDGADRGDYAALQAYLPPTADTDAALSELRLAIRARYGFATTAGYGPRFLHSTGQLHKGGRGNGVFVQLTADPVEDLAIPPAPGDDPESGYPLTFGTLLSAQAAGDRAALEEAGRRVIRFDVGPDPAGAIGGLAEELAAPQ
ncbi:MAG: glucose-6-phosphate isomerase [Gemmatimonadota bacterium]